MSLPSWQLPSPAPRVGDATSLTWDDAGAPGLLEVRGDRTSVAQVGEAMAAAGVEQALWRRSSDALWLTRPTTNGVQIAATQARDCPLPPLPPQRARAGTPIAALTQQIPGLLTSPAPQALAALTFEICRARGLHLPDDTRDTEREFARVFGPGLARLDNADAVLGLRQQLRAMPADGLRHLPDDSPGRLRELHLRHHARAGQGGRAQAGAWYTPPVLAGWLAAALGDAPGRVLDPACGGGSLLIAVGRRALAQMSGAPLQARVAYLGRTLAGVDLDPISVGATGMGLALLALRAPLPTPDRVTPTMGVAAGLQRGDALALPLPPIDAVIMNPPFRAPRGKAGQQRRMSADPYPAFVQLAARVLPAHGQLAAVLPDAVLARDKAAPTRRTLLHLKPRRLWHAGAVFQAQVSVVTLHAGGQDPGPTTIDRAWSGRPLPSHQRDPRDWARAEHHAIDLHCTAETARARRTARAQTTTLGAICTISRGEELGARSLPTTGPVPLRAGGDIHPHTLARPSRACPQLAKGAEFYAGPKLLVRKTGRGCVAALDPSNTPVLQSLYLVRGRDEQTDLRVLALVLNSRWMQRWLATGFSGSKRVFPQLNQSSLAALPVPHPDAIGTATLTALASAAAPEDADWRAQVDRAVDAILDPDGTFYAAIRDQAQRFGTSR